MEKFEPRIEVMKQKAMHGSRASVEESGNSATQFFDGFLLLFFSKAHGDDWGSRQNRYRCISWKSAPTLVGTSVGTSPIAHRFCGSTPHNPATWDAILPHELLHVIHPPLYREKLQNISWATYDFSVRKSSFLQESSPFCKTHSVLKCSWCMVAVASTS